MSKKVCDEWLARRIKSVGRLSADRVKKLVGPNGKLDWTLAGVFSFVGAGATLQVRHCDGQIVDTPEGFAFNNKYVLQDNHADSLASVVVSSLTPIRLKSFFPKHVGPNTASLLNRKSSVTNTLADEVYADMQQAKISEDVDAKRVRDVHQALEDNTSDRKREAAAKRKPKTPPAKKHRVMMGSILASPEVPTPAPIADS